MSQVKKILYLHQYFAFPDSNAGTRSYDLSKHFIENGYEVHIITGSGYINSDYISKSGWNEIRKDGLVVHALSLDVNNKMSFFKRILGFIKFLIKSTLKILSLKGDVVIATSTPLTIAVPAIIKRFIYRTPFIFEVRDVWPDVPIAMGIIKNPLLIFAAKLLEKFAYSNAAHIVALSTDMSQLIKDKGIQANRLSTITNISHISRFQNNYQKLPSSFPNKKIVLYTGTFGFVNELSYMVNLAAEVKKHTSEIVFVALGDGIDKANVQKRAEEKNVLNENFFFLPPVSKKELPAILNQATVSCSWVGDIPALWANSANKFFDALAAGKPIVINHGGWQNEAILNHNAGFVLPADLTDDTITAFTEYILSDALIAESSKNAFLLGKEKYSLEVLGKDYVTILNKVISTS
jgi:glycosyltransferase involved in cell wall biosynthesis